MQSSSDFDDNTMLPTIDRFSDLAKIRFIADSSDSSYRGSNKQEVEEIRYIRGAFRDYLFDSNPPEELVNELLPIANKLLSATDTSVLWMIGFYEPIEKGK
jgi:hypothetical protein